MNRFRPRLLPWIRLTLVAAVLATVAPLASGQYCTPDECDACNLNTACLQCCHDLPELWVINTRSAPKCANLDAGFERLSFNRWDPACRRFVKETCESFVAQEATMPTLMFGHGNTLKHEQAMKQCWQIYQRLRCCPGQKRLVFWSWPAQVAIKRPLLFPRKLIEKNLKIKFVYAEYQGYYMAKLVQQMSLSQRVTLGGHSYGGITAAVALHYLGGGTLRGLTLEGGAPVERAHLRGAIVSGAFDNDALIPGYRYGQAFVAAEKIYNTRNIRDKTLDSWPKVSLRGRKAVGVTGVNANLLGPYRSKLCQHTLTSDVERSHYMAPHLESRKFVSALCCIAFPQCVACTQMAEQTAGDSLSGLATDSPQTLPSVQTPPGSAPLQLRASAPAAAKILRAPFAAISEGFSLSDETTGLRLGDFLGGGRSN